MNNTEPDAIDRHILSLLQLDGRLSIARLAAEVNLSATPCAERVRRLEQAGYIKRFAAILDPAKFNAGYIAFVQVKLSSTVSAVLDAFNRAVLDVPEIESCHMIAADFDYLLKIRCRDIDQYRRLLGERISTLPSVIQTSTFTVMQSVKDDVLLSVAAQETD